jgi:hypothetical protein
MDHEAHLAAVAALQAVWPGLTWKEASAEAVNAVAFASTYHAKWFWRGVGVAVRHPSPRFAQDQGE